jgi:hypothetical protein
MQDEAITTTTFILVFAQRLCSKKNMVSTSLQMERGGAEKISPIGGAHLYLPFYGAFGNHA